MMRGYTGGVVRDELEHLDISLVPHLERLRLPHQARMGGAML